jgi:hypothetical protein
MYRGRIRFWRLPQRAAYNEVATGARIAHDGGMLIFTILQGLSSGLRVHESPLYRYPYRTAEEAFRGDAKKIYQDVEASLERGHE